MSDKPKTTNEVRQQRTQRYVAAAKDNTRVKAGKVPADSALRRSDARSRSDFIKDYGKPVAKMELRKSEAGSGKTTADAYARNRTDRVAAGKKRETDEAKVMAMKEKLNKSLAKRKMK